MARTTFRSDAGVSVRLLFFFLLACPSFAAEPAELVWPLEPADGASVVARPVFRIGYEARPDVDPRRVRFRLSLDPVTSGEPAYLFDQRLQPKGWLQGDEDEVLYRPLEPLADGAYRWRVWTWDGVAWTGGDRRFDLRVDTVAPADVEGLTVKREPASGELILQWNPVTMDRDGRPEYVARYHVFRYVLRGLFRGVRTFEIGSTVAPRFVDESPPAGTSLLFYKVTAEDEAGNVAERPR